VMEIETLGALFLGIHDHSDQAHFASISKLRRRASVGMNCPATVPDTPGLQPADPGEWLGGQSI